MTKRRELIRESITKKLLIKHIRAPDNAEKIRGLYVDFNMFMFNFSPFCRQNKEIIMLVIYEITVDIDAPSIPNVSVDIRKKVKIIFTKDPTVKEIRGILTFPVPSNAVLIIESNETKAIPGETSINSGAPKIALPFSNKIVRTSFDAVKKRTERGIVTNEINLSVVLMPSYKYVLLFLIFVFEIIGKSTADMGAISVPAKFSIGITRVV